MVKNNEIWSCQKAFSQSIRMKILKTQVLRGPNIWSNYRKKLIQIRLDLEEMEQFPTDKIPGFSNRLQEMFPGMIEDECSEGIRGGFYPS